MTVASQTPLASSTANGVTTTFPHAFTVLLAGDLKVTGTLSGVTTTYVHGVDYTITGLGTNSGSVIFTAAPASGTLVTRYRDTAITRATDYQNNGDLPAAVLNADIDRQVYILQEVVAGGKGSPTSIRVPNGETVPALPDAASRANSIQAYDGAGNPIVVDLIAGASLAASVNSQTATAAQTLFSLSRAITQGLASSVVVTVDGLQLEYGVDFTHASATSILFAVPFVGGERVTFFMLPALSGGFDATQVSTTAGGAGAVARSQQSKNAEIVSVGDFGAVGDGVTDDTAAMQAAHTWANGRPVYYPRGTYKFSTISLSKAGDGIVGDQSGGLAGTDGTLLVSTVTGTTAAVQLTASTAHNVLLKDFTLKQNSTVQGRGIVAADCYWLRTDNLRVTGFTDNLYCSLSIYHHHKRLLSENSTNGVNYWGASGTWNTAWFNNVVTFDTCRFSDCTVTGASIKGCEVVFIAPDFTGMSAVGAIGLKVYGESASFKAHGIKIISPYAENVKTVFSFLNAKVEIDGDGFVQGGVNVGAQAKSIIDADASTVTWSSIEDKDYWEFGYRLTNGSTLRMGALFSGSIRATSGTADATSTFLPDTYTAGTFTITLTGCTATITGTATWEKRGNTVNLLIPALSGTSNTTAASLTGIPTEIRPATEQFSIANVQNNGADVIGSLRIFTSGTIGIAAGVFGTAFSASGIKGLRAGSVVYHVG